MRMKQCSVTKDVSMVGDDLSSALWVVQSAGGRRSVGNFAMRSGEVVSFLVERVFAWATSCVRS